MPKSVFVSADLEWNLKGLVERIWDELDLIRIYTKPRGQAPDYNEPVVLPRKKCTVENFCNRIHKQILRQFKYALVWGLSVKHFPQKVGRDHTLIDEDIIQIIKKI
jgi:ribosome-interacting GTPase 1